MDPRPHSRPSSRGSQRDEQRSPASLASCVAYLQEHQLCLGEVVLGSWAVTMADSVYTTVDRILVVTSLALYRLHWVVSVKHKHGGYCRKCKRMPVETIHRVFKWNGRVTVLERHLSTGPWSRLLEKITENEPSDARPWRDNSHVLHSQEYIPALVHELGDREAALQQVISQIVKTLHDVAPWSDPSAPASVIPPIRCGAARPSTASSQYMTVASARSVSDLSPLDSSPSRGAKGGAVSLEATASQDSQPSGSGWGFLRSFGVHSPLSQVHPQPELRELMDGLADAEPQTDGASDWAASRKNRLPSSEEVEQLDGRWDDLKLADAMDDDLGEGASSIDLPHPSRRIPSPQKASSSPTSED
ncbi:hypothetical protein AB1Y20_022126 [Prymnesium parvum]|uniref:Uncharacterized protein n=1 Tax=Prymnesium parvum TaxID=97485 RepID=A0AB34JFZ2_PRYPA|mmetsp:Transcript_2043/g.5119  ORF Transcript_2043/g.5119 Transcript_2043/m.5119 type:complete len:360 (+) Transcript_2043:270-1349(+)